jgi:hypothetical protein
MRVEHSNALTLEFRHPQTNLCKLFQFPHYSGKAKPHCQATPDEFGSLREANCAGFVDTCLQILDSF